jgi:predicted metal-binding protein
MEPLKAHLFICTNSPNKEGKCGNKNSEDLRAQVKDLCKKQPWSKEVRINASGCLGQCERGISAVLYPEGRWFLDLKATDAEILFKAVKETAEKHK